MGRLWRQSVRGLLSYTGSEADILSAGIIGRHMVVPRNSDVPLKLFRYGQPYSGRCDDPGAVQVIRTIGGDLAVLCHGKGDDTPSEMPPWGATVVGNVVTLATAKSSPDKKMRRRRIAGSPGQPRLRLVWSAPA